MFGMTQDQMEESLSVNYPRLLKKAGKFENHPQQQQKKIELLTIFIFFAETRRMTYNAVIGIDIEPIVETQLKRKELESSSSKNDNKRAKKVK